MKRRKQKHTYLFNCACVMFVYLASVQYVFAVKDENTLVFTSGWFKTERAASYDTIRHSAYLPAVVDTFGNFHTDRPGVRSTAATITLAINPAVVVSAPYDVILSGFCRSKSQFGAVDSVPFTLQINYRPAAGAQYKQRDAITITNCVHALVVASITVNGLAIATEQDTTFTVEVNISGDLVYPPNPMQSPSFYPIKEDITARNIKWSWTPLPWAEFYELEYLYIDNYKSDGTRRPRTSLRYNFRTDAVRIRVYGNEYELPVVFEQGYLVARVRGVGFRGSSYQIPVWGNWSLSDTGTLPERGHSVFEITPEKAHEADRLNWQYQSVFNENGERSEAVTYADGTLRIRQSVTNSPETNKILVTETFYDHHGRVAITTLPAPVKPNAPVFTPPVFVPPGTIGTGTAPGTLPGLSGTSVLGNKNVIGVINWRSDRFSNILPTGFSLPAGVSPYGINLEQLRGLELNNLLSILRYRSQRARLGYVPRFHVNVEGGNILRAHYDRDAPCDTTSLVLGTQSGAGRYYSPFNDEKARWQAYVPDGGGRPYLQVKYTNDGTGRVRETNLPGYAHRIGGGHSQKYYYGTPSQAELDRFFGNDAGHASFYKKTMIMDENGQAHVSIHDLKGNLVLSAYAGAKPENLDTVTNITVASDTIDLIAENNILLEEENAWVSNKRIALSAPTELSLSYRLVNPRYEGRLCMGTPVCYDCIYDLEITITDACGATRLEHRQTIGSLEPLSTCQTHTVNFGRTLRLDPGSYHIVKKLKVNAASIDQYVQHYTEQFTCSTNYTMFLPDIEAACTPRCITCIYDNITTRFVRRDGREVTLNHYKRRAGNNSSCQFACPRVGLSEIAMAWQTMLSEVSPGGQYAEYRDTSRLEDRPMGVINPAAFPLSVLNDDNQLPLRNATWRNPAFNYQTRTGETYYVPIADDGTPAHRSPESEIIVRDGRRHVLVKYLNDVSDFIRLWEPQWAEALVVYHPEYEYFLWNLRNRGSFSFDSLMLATERYADALRYGLTDYRNDPLFATPGALRAEIENRLNNAGALGGTTLTAAQLTIVSVHCGNPNFSEAQLRECYSTRTLFATPEAQDKEWVVYKALYRKMKQRVLANERNRAVTAGGGFNNRTIGGTRDVPANSLYAGKRRVFREEDDVHDELETDFAGEDPTLAEVEELRQRIMAERYRACGVCPVASDLTTLFNALNYDGKLTAPGVTLPGISPLVLTKNIVNSFSVSTALQYHWSRLSDSNPNVLRFKITTGGVEVCMLSLEKRKTEISWDSLFVFDCFQATGAYTFTMRIIDINGRIDTIQGQSSCFRVGECSFPPTCAATPARREMLTFLQYLFERNRYRSSMLTVHTHTSHSPHFGPTLRNVHPTGQTWHWSFGGFTSGDNRVFTARLSISEGRGALSASPINCDFTFTVLTPGFNFDSVGFVIALRKPSATPTADAVYEGEMIVRSRGGRIFSVRITNTCYVLFRCTSVSQRPSSRSAVCCLPSPRLVPLQDDCEESLRMIARREAERDFQLRRSFAADTLRAAYIRRCLSRVPEIFLVSYNDAIYMATLYYYDQSGALVKTVPPKGVRSLSSTQIANSINHRRNGTGSPVYPNHRMATVYRYTSLGTLAEKISPDEGATQYAYDYAGRQILSRDATQRTNNQASYIVYDANNRIVETGRTRHGDVWQTFRPYTAHLSSLSNKAE
ncbi:MAG: hypothetical protein RML37_03325, partial [Chitinophagales bacterium]|nr:hypothetical protein [Chitinophagales bacterium]